MPYTSNSLAGPTHLGGAGDARVMVYQTLDPLATVLGTGYFADGIAKGMTLGDVVFVLVLAGTIAVPTSVTSITMHTVSAVNTTTGTATLSNPVTAGASNLNAAASPTTTNDTTQGYSVGSVWVDQTNRNAWLARIVTASAARWDNINNDVVLSVSAVTLASAALTVRLVAPFDGRVTQVRAVINGTVGGVNKVFTTAVSGSTITSGGFTVLNTSVPGTIASSALITTGNTMVAGNQIILNAVAAAMSGSRTANFFVLCRRST